MNATTVTKSRAGRGNKLGAGSRLFLVGRWTLLIVSAIALVFALAATFLLRGSLPQLDGERSLVGLDASVTIERDDLGVPRILAETRLDVARALGFLHAQDRFFQMDLLRRRASGELSELLGGALLETDRENRRHGFAHLAPQVLAQLTERQLAILESYAGGVNAGLDALRVRPFEYLLLRQRPRAWKPEDSLLVLYAMSLELSLDSATTESMLGLMHDELAPATAAYLSPRGNPWEAPIVGEPYALPPIPTTAQFEAAPKPSSSTDALTVEPANEPTDESTTEAADRAGSNNWVVGGVHTFDGRGLLANDMHLGLNLPNIWYRAEMHWRVTDEDGPSVERRTVGVTLPGTPALVAGSNGFVAWGLTNSYGDFADLVVVEIDAQDSTRYRTPAGFETFTTEQEVIEVAGATDDTFVVRATRWGPLWDRDHRGRPRALRWTAHDPRATNFALLDLEDARDVDEAVATASRCGIPPQNFVCTDLDGRVAWTIAGRIPRRLDPDRRVPAVGADATTAWDGYLEPSEQPRIVDPPEARLWTANARVVDRDMLRRLGDGGYAIGARARQIRDGLRSIEGATERDMLSVQLDDRALFLSEWRDEVLALYNRRPPAKSSKSAEFESWVRASWDGRASIESVGYRLVRSFRLKMIDAVYGHLAASCYAADARFRPGWLPHPSAIVLELLRTQPPSLLDPAYEDWDEWMVAVAEDCVRAAEQMPGGLEDFRWGSRNTVRLRHPLTYAVPQLMRWLAFEPRELPGGSFMPRVQHPHHGATERMVVSPGHEEDGLFHMPGGQSGHPLSPYFRAGHIDWEQGNARALLVGATEHSLTLVK